MKKIVLALVIFCSCNQKVIKYEKLHDKYRTLWYRTGQDCFYDSSKKYGELYRIERGWADESNDIDTVRFNGLTPDCK